VTGGPEPVPLIPLPDWLAGAASSGAAPPAAGPREHLGVKIVGDGVDPKALAACEVFITQLIGNNPAAQEALKNANVAIVVIPHDKKMTDLPQFAALAGTNTFDGRLWDNVRGSGGMTAPDGTFALAVGEENLITGTGTPDSYPAGYSVGMHEFAHTLHDKGLTADQKTKIDELFAARTAAGGPWTEAYGSSNEHEYFAQATNAFFGTNQGIGQNGRAWLEANDPAMCAFLDELYVKK
jgi:hypothetical protein